jgi:hypothetical protein
MRSFLIFVADIAPVASASSQNAATSWELALVTAPSSNGNATTSRKMVHITLTLSMIPY